MSHLIHASSWQPAVRRCARAAACLVVALPAIAHADPTQADAPVPPMQLESALSHYQSKPLPKAMPWPQANEQVARIGGWRTYAREAHAPDADATEPSPSPEPGAASMHKHHKHMHHEHRQEHGHAHH